jgi:DNA-binding transcriptional ArsR family regulator
MTTRALQEASQLILTALAAGSRHGYGIITDVRQISGGRVQLRPGTLYTALARLRADGLVKVDREEIIENRLRRYYRLSLVSASLPSADVADEGPAPPPDLRIGDAEREAAATALGEHFAQGRLTFDELTARLDATFAATTRREIARTIQDLPCLPGPCGWFQPHAGKG